MSQHVIASHLYHAAVVCNLHCLIGQRKSLSMYLQESSRTLTWTNFVLMYLMCLHLCLQISQMSIKLSTVCVPNSVKHKTSMLRLSRERDVILRPDSPRYSDSLREAKRERRRCERQMLKSSLQVHRKSTEGSAGETMISCSRPKQTVIVRGSRPAANMTSLSWLISCHHQLLERLQLFLALTPQCS